MVQKITVIGQRLAKAGNEFYFMGEMEECKKCKVRGTCLNLDEGRKYQVKDIRSKKLLNCGLHDEGVVAIFVEPATVSALIDAKKAVKGAQFTFEPIRYNLRNVQIDEEYESMLNPEGLFKGDKCTISEIGESVNLDGQIYKVAELLPSF